MKKVILMALLISSSSIFAETVKVEVNGLVCSLCAQGIKKKFTSIDEVKTINVDLNNKLVTIETKDNKNISDEKIKEVITESGFITVAIKRDK